MRIGLTYNLRSDYLSMGWSMEQTAEFDSPETIRALEESLTGMGHEVSRIGGIEALVCALAAGNRWDLVFNIAEGAAGFGREAQIPALLDAYAIPYTFSDPLIMAVTMHKAMTKRILRDMDLPTPQFWLVERIDRLPDLPADGTYFAKPVAEGTSKGISRASIVRSRDELEQVCRELLTAFDQPVLVERYLPGREFTVGIVGTGERARSLGVMEVLLTAEAEEGVYSYGNKQEYERRVTYRTADDGAAQAAAVLGLAAWRALDCRDGGRVDIRLDEAGRPQFMEVNPLPGLHPINSDLPILCRLQGMPYSDLVKEILSSALERTTGATVPAGRA